jgi:hypothetical protein
MENKKEMLNISMLPYLLIFIFVIGGIAFVLYLFYNAFINPNTSLLHYNAQIDNDKTFCNSQNLSLIDSDYGKSLFTCFNNTSHQVSVYPIENVVIN